MALFSKKENEKSPEELSKEIKETKARVKKVKSEISNIKTEGNKAINDIKEKIEEENSAFDNAMKEVETNKKAILKESKSFEAKKQKTKAKMETESNRVENNIENLQEKADKAKEKSLKNTKKSLIAEIESNEKEYTDKKERLEQEKKEIVEHYSSLKQFELKALEEVKKLKNKLLGESEEKIKEIKKQEDNLSKDFDANKKLLNTKHEDEKNEINEKIAELLSKQKSELKQLYEDLDSLNKKRNELSNKYDKEKKEIEKEYSQLVIKHKNDKETAINYNNALQVDLKKERTQFDDFVEKHNAEFEERQAYLGKLIEQIPSEISEIEKEKKTELSEREKELSKKADELKRSFDNELDRKYSSIDREISSLKVELEKNTKLYEQNIKVVENNNESIRKDCEVSLNAVTNEKNDLLAEINQLDIDYKEKIRQMNAHLSETKKNNEVVIAKLAEKMKEEIDALTASYENSRNEKIDQIKQEISIVKNEINQLNAEHKQFTDDFANKKETLLIENEKDMNLLFNERDSLTSSINLIREEMNTKKDDFVKQIADINIRIDNAKNEKVEKMQSMTKEHEQDLIELQQKYDNMFSEIKSSFDNKCVELEKSANERKSNIEQERNELEKSTNERIARIEQEGVETRTKYESQITQTINQKADILKQIEDIKSNVVVSEQMFNQEFAQLSQSFEETKNAMEAKHASTIEEIVTQYEKIPSKDIEQLKVKLEGEKEKYTALNAQLFEQRQQIEVEFEKERTGLVARKNEITNEIEKKNAILSDLVREKDSEYNVQVDRVESKKAELAAIKDKIKEEIQEIGRNHNVQLANLTDDYNKKYNDVVSKYNQEEELLKKRLDGEVEYVIRDYDHKRQDLDTKLKDAILNKDKIETELKAKYNIELEKTKTVENELKILEKDYEFKKNDYANRIGLKKKESEDTINSLKQKHDDEIDDMKGRYGEILNDLNAKKTQIYNDIDLLISEYNNKTKAIEEVKQSKSKDIALLKIQITQLVEQFNKNDVFGEKQAKLELMHNKRMQKIKQDYTAIIEEFENLQNSKHGTGDLISSNEKEITAKTEEFKKVLDSLNTKHINTMEELKKQYDATLSKISTDFKEYVDGNKHAIDNCDKDVATLQNTYDNLLLVEDQKYRKLVADIEFNRKQLKMIENQFNANIKQIESGYENLNDEEIKKTERYIESERKAFDKEISSINKEIDSLSKPKNSLDSKIKGLVVEQTNLENEIVNQKQRLVDLLQNEFNKLVTNYKDRVIEQKEKLKEFDIYGDDRANIFKK